MASIDTYSMIKVVQALEAIVVNNDTEGTGVVVDTAGYEGCTIVVNVGASGDTLSETVKHSLTLQEGALADGTDMAAVAEADMLGATAGTTTGQFALIDDPAEDSTVVKVGYRGTKQYVRIFDDTTGTHTNGTPMSASAILSHPMHAPVA